MHKFDIPKSLGIKLTQQDIKRAQELLKYEWFKNKEWQKEINHMLKEGIKFEQQVLSNKSIRFVSETYLPTKLEQKDFLP